MTERYYVLTEERRRQFEEMLSWFQQNRTRLGSANFEEQDYLTPETYLARTPITGIPAMSGVTPGSATCTIYTLSPTTGTLVKIDGLTFTVYNFSDVTITGSVFVLITREKFGVWAVAQQYEDSVPGTGTGTGGDSGGGSEPGVFSGARVYNSGTISVTTAVVEFLTFDTQRFDTDSYHSTGTNPNRITVPSDGKYSVGCSINASATFGLETASLGVGIYHNRGATQSVIANQSLRVTSDIIGNRASCMESLWDCLAGDYFQVGVLSSTNAATVLAGSANDARNSDFWIQKVG